MAVAELINQTGLHRRIALKIMTLVGEKPGNFTIQYERHSFHIRNVISSIFQTFQNSEKTN